MTGYTTADKFKYWLFQDRIPLTKILILSNVITFLLVFLFKLGVITTFLSFRTPFFTAMPWTALTYPLVWATPDLLSLLFSCYWLWVAGGSIERSWGIQRFAPYFFIMSGITALGLFAGSFVTHVPLELVNLWLPIAGLTIAFAMMNPEQQILFMFVIPLKLKYLAIISAAMVLVQYGMTSPLLGVFALAGCAFSYFYVRRPVSYSAPSRQKPAEVVRVFEKPSIWKRLNPFAWIKEWNDRRRLKKLFERSHFDD